MLLHYMEDGAVRQIQIEDIGDLVDEFGHQNVVEALVELHGQDDDDLFDILRQIVGDAWEE